MYYNNILLCHPVDIARGGILDLLHHNLDLNTATSSITTNSTATNSSTSNVMELDFFWDSPSSYPPELMSRLTACDVILAADVVYDPQITSRFFHTLKTILGLGGPKTAYVAVERRERAEEGGGVAAPNFDLFMSHLRDLDGLQLVDGGLRLRVEAVGTERIPQYFQYSRVQQLTLWKVVSAKQS